MRKIKLWRIVLKLINNVQIITGDEDFLINEYISSYTKKLNIATLNLNYIYYKENEIEFIKVIENAQQIPFMDKYRLIIYQSEDFLRNLDLISEKELNSFFEYLDNPIETTFLLIITDKIDKRLKLYKKLNKKIKFIDFSSLDRINFSNFVDIETKKYSVVFSKTIKDYFINKSKYLEKDSNVSLFDIHNQIKKLASLKDKNITIDVLNDIMDNQEEKNFFKLIDYVFDKNYKKSIELLYSLNRNQISLVLIYSQLINNIFTILKIKILELNSCSSIPKMLSIHPYIYKKNRIQSKNFSIDKLIKLYKFAMDFEYKLKTGKIDELIALEILISKITN